MLLLDPKNFTPRSRTPWAGSQISRTIKSNYVASADEKIGESWEFSCDPSKYSHLLHSPELTLSAFLENDPARNLGAEQIAQGRSQVDILCKLLNADAPLSLQIHPDDHHPMLKVNESGKPESWLVLTAEKGAGLYLGFTRTFAESELRSHLENNTFQQEWLNFVPIQAGDYFEISPGVPHAIAPGSVIFEPQRIRPNASGVTWRLWDWNRKYNSEGIEDSNGTGRALHIQESLSLLYKNGRPGLSMTNPDQFVDELRRTAIRQQTTAGIDFQIYPRNSYYQVSRINLASAVAFDFGQYLPGGSYSIITCISGSFSCPSAFQSQRPNSVSMHKGLTAFQPASSKPPIIIAGPEGCELIIVKP
jgi:mannose-6-phosphate isomerase